MHVRELLKYESDQDIFLLKTPQGTTTVLEITNKIILLYKLLYSDIIHILYNSPIESVQFNGF